MKLTYIDDDSNDSNVESEERIMEIQTTIAGENPNDNKV